MIYKFRMISADDTAFLRDFEIDSCESFLGLHKLIQDNLDYNANQLASFFVADEGWNKGIELTLLDMQNDAGPAAIPMDSVKLEDLVKEKKDRLLYVYDIFSDSAFFLELMDKYPQKKGIRYPTCSASIGDAPDQLLASNSSGDIEGVKDDSIRNMFSEFETDEHGFESFDGDDN